jgi:predicted RNA-binding protein YlxR (DUF448 family)
VGCGARVDKDRVRHELVRLVLVPGDRDGEPMRACVDLAAKSFGRGAWVHARPSCFSQAAKRGLARAAKARVVADPDRLRGELLEQAKRRVRSLIGTAFRTGRAAVGAGAVREALQRGPVALLVVAEDAAAAAKHREIALAMGEGKGVLFGTKDFLGEALGREEVGVIAVEDEGMAAAIRHTIGLSETFARRTAHDADKQDDERVRQG